ncbi:FAD-dependent monooxygenase [Streptomyces cyaneofuscatus]|uniref:FAD-dependent monooxygenase n=1 Tax=Streptomyces cyaneofuscatus TaxID=66883 RepID=UPI0036865122
MVRDTDVAVVGGGPVDMLLAAEPALHGVRTTVLERLPVPTGESKAGTLHARTAQTLNRRGLLEAVQPGPHRASAHPHRQVPCPLRRRLRPGPRPGGGGVPRHAGQPAGVAYVSICRRTTRPGP